jgi:hypothetical protein
MRKTVNQRHRTPIRDVQVGVADGANPQQPPVDGVEMSTVADAPAWDAFLEQVGASHTQSSSWGQAKGSLGWRAVRVVARRGGDIVGGAQVLIRPVARLGRVGYIANGPVLGVADPALLDLLLRELRRTARCLRVQHVTLQPPRGSDGLSRTLAAVTYPARPG